MEKDAAGPSKTEALLSEYEIIQSTNCFSLGNTLVALRFYLTVTRYSQRDLTDQLLPQTPLIFSPLRCTDLKYDKLACYGFAHNLLLHKTLWNYDFYSSLTQEVA